METNEFIREILNKITPAILKGKTVLTLKDETAINVELKKEAVILFAAGKINEAKEIGLFIESNPKFKIWPGNGFEYMIKNCSNPDTENKIIIYSDEKHFNGMQELDENIEKIKQRQQDN